MANPLQPPTAIGGITVSSISDANNVKLIANNNESVIATENDVTINAGYLETAIDVVTDNTTFTSNQKIIKLDLPSADKVFILPPCADNEGRQYTVIRIDSNNLFTATITPTLGDKLNTVTDETLTLGPGCHVTLQCVGGNDGWFIGL